MAKKQTRRSISVSRTTYERLKAFCEANNISMSQLVETRVNDFLGEGATTTTITPRPTPPSPMPHTPRPTAPASIPSPAKPSTDAAAHSSSAGSMGMGSMGNMGGMGSMGSVASQSSPQRPSAPAIPMTSAAARYAVEPPPPIIKPKQQDTNAPKPAEKRADQIFTF